MDDIELWFDPGCSKCAGAEQLLRERGVEPTYVRYRDDPPELADLQAVLQKLGTPDPRTIARTSEPLYDELGLATADAEVVLQALLDHPDLLQRPIAVRGGRAVVARPPERVLELLDADGAPGD